MEEVMHLVIKRWIAKTTTATATATATTTSYKLDEFVIWLLFNYINLFNYCKFV